MKRIFLVGCLIGCAEAVPGFEPPDDRLHYPQTMALTEVGGGKSVLLISNTNFDQRYQTGTVMSFDVERLFALVPEDGEPIFVEDFPREGLLAGRARIRSFAGELVVVPAAPEQNARLLVPSRGIGRATLLSLGSDGGLSCSGPQAAAVRPYDCAEANVLNTRYDDAFAAAFAPEFGARGTVLLGHLRFERAGGTPLSPVSVVDVAAFEQRAETGSLVGPDSAEYPLLTATYSGLSGISGLTYVPGTGFVAVSRGEVPLSAWVFRPVETATRGQIRADVSRDVTLDLQASTLADEGRGLVASADGTRVYVSVRFPEGNAFNAAIAVLQVGPGSLVLKGVLEVGEELGRPFLLERPGQRWLYVPDLRSDTVWVLDVTADQPVVVAQIRGRINRQIDGKTVQARLLDGPAHIVFATQQGRTLGFVSNFANSTLAVIDATDSDPRRHRVVARLGMDRDADGLRESER